MGGQKVTVARLLAIATYCFAAWSFYQYVAPNEDRSKSSTVNFPTPHAAGYSPTEYNSPLDTVVSWPDMMKEPPDTGYPVYRSLLDIVTEWNPDNPEPPAAFRETIQRFNYSDLLERSYAEKFRNAELPFKMYNIPDMQTISAKWNDNYLSEKMASEQGHVEKSRSNHFMYWNNNRDRSRKFTPPTDVIKMKFKDWLVIAKAADATKLLTDTIHYYFMTGAPANDNLRSFISADLPIFSTRRNNFFISNVYANKGIQCRFGMRGIIAEAHYDSGRNMVAMIKGAKRYILAPPSACKKLGIIADVKDPSYRHSVIDWSDINQAATKGFNTVDAIETIVQSGEVLYIPSYWFHYIVSLKYSIQCNSRSGSPPNGEGQTEIENCVGTPHKWYPIALLYFYLIFVVLTVCSPLK